MYILRKLELIYIYGLFYKYYCVVKYIIIFMFKLDSFVYVGYNYSI